MNRLFLTGATGFIGSYVLQSALRMGVEVVALRRSISSQPVIPIDGSPLWLEGELNDLKSEHLAGCDVVLHLACAGVSPKRVGRDEMFEVNVLGSCRLLKCVEKAAVKRAIFTGSCHEYGSSASTGQPISANAPLLPLTDYGATKAAAFALALAYSRQCDFEFFYGRIFSTYGEGQFLQNFWPSLRVAALNGDDFPMTKGDQVRDFTSVHLVAQQLLSACAREDLYPGQPIVANIGSGLPQTLLGFAEREWEGMKAMGRLLPGALPKRTDEPSHFVPDLSEIRL